MFANFDYVGKIVVEGLKPSSVRPMNDQPMVVLGNVWIQDRRPGVAIAMQKIVNTRTVLNGAAESLREKEESYEEALRRYGSWGTKNDKVTSVQNAYAIAEGNLWTAFDEFLTAFSAPAKVVVHSVGSYHAEIEISPVEPVEEENKEAGGNNDLPIFVFYHLYAGDGIDTGESNPLWVKVWEPGNVLAFVRKDRPLVLLVDGGVIVKYPATVVPQGNDDGNGHHDNFEPLEVGGQVVQLSADELKGADISLLPENMLAEVAA